MIRLVFCVAILMFILPWTVSGAGLVLHWTFDEKDGSGNVPDRALTNGPQDGSPVLGGMIDIDNANVKVGAGAAHFVNGTGDEVLWRDSGQPIASGANMSMAYWFRTNSGGTRTSAHAGLGGTVYHRVRAINLDADTGDRELRMTARGPGDGELNDNGATNIRDDQWHHIAYVVSGIAGADRQLYLDGNLEIAGSSPLADSFGIEHVGIGALVRSNIDVVDHLADDSWIDEFQIYNGALSPSAVSYLVNNPGAVVPEPGGLLLGVACVLGLWIRPTRRR